MRPGRLSFPMPSPSGRRGVRSHTPPFIFISLPFSSPQIDSPSLGIPACRGCGRKLPPPLLRLQVQGSFLAYSNELRSSAYHFCLSDICIEEAHKKIKLPSRLHYPPWPHLARATEPFLAALPSDWSRTLKAELISDD